MNKEKMSERAVHLGIIGLVAIFVIVLIGLLAQESNFQGHAFRSLESAPLVEESNIEPQQSAPLFSNAELEEIFPGLDPDTAQQRMTNFMSADEPPKTADYFGWVYINGKPAPPGTVIKAIAPGVDNGNDYECGSYTIDPKWPGIMGYDGFLHCMCGGGKFPDCAGSDIEFEVYCSDTLHGPATSQSPTTWQEDTFVGSIFNTGLLEEYNDTTYNGVLTYDGIGAGSELQIRFELNGEVCGEYNFTDINPSAFPGITCTVDPLTDACTELIPEIIIKHRELGFEWTPEIVSGNIALTGGTNTLQLNLENIRNDFSGILKIDGEDAPEGVTIRVWHDLWGFCGYADTDESGYWQVACFCPLGTVCPDGQQLKAQMKVPAVTTAWNDLEVIGDMSWVDNSGIEIKQAFLEIHGVLQNYFGSLTINGLPGAGAIIKIAKEGSDPWDFRGETLVNPDGTFGPARAWCLSGQVCNNGDNMSLRFTYPDSLDLWYPIITGDTSWSDVDGVSRTVSLNQPSDIQTEFFGAITIEGEPAPLGTDFVTITENYDWGQNCGGDSETSVYAPGLYATSCYCDGYYSLPCDPTRELIPLVRPNRTGGQGNNLDYIATPTQTMIADGGSHNIDIDLSGKMTTFYGKALYDDQVPENTYIYFNKEYSWMSGYCGRGLVDEQGNYEVDCWCNEDIVFEDPIVPYDCIQGDMLNVSLYMNNNWYQASAFGKNEPVWDNVKKELDVYVFSAYCEDGTPIGRCRADHPKRCNEDLEIVNDCQTCGCPPPVRVDTIEKWDYYGCCPGGSCTLNYEETPSGISCPGVVGDANIPEIS